MMIRLVLLGLTCCSLLGCVDGGQGFGHGIQINSGSYDWTDQVRDARGFPQGGWGDIIQDGGGSTGSM
ncbi:MAG TPA: hypothetical protein VHX19_11325 [Stellaceae bacterium]|jgi:hypothetical protein|nr:hypothetical protein [Stellaceae bacterium]